VIASLALSFLSVCAPRASAAVVAAEAVALAPVRSAPLALPPFLAPSALQSLAAVPAALAAPLPAAAPAPLAAAPALAPAPALASPPAAASAAPPPSARRGLTEAAAPELDASAAAFDGERFAPAVGAIEDRPAPRLQVLSAAELGVGAEPEAPRPPSSDPKPFLYRHYRLARAIVVPVLRLLYGIRVDGRANLPSGPVLIVPNHVSFLDPVLISFAANRPLRFLMYRPIYETRGLQWLFRSLGAIPIATKDPKDLIQESLNRARRALAAGESVVIFPEGVVTRDGSFSPFRRGFERIALGLRAAVVPAYIDGMWGSALSRHPLKNWKRALLARLRGRRPVAVRFGPELERADAGLAREAVGRLAAAPPAPPAR
jgi:1-acyl-sn-glycerol-3-phosphate acyltransferase